MPWGLRKGRIGGRALTACLAGLMLAPGAVWASPWIPAGGTGTIKPMIRYSSGDRAFSASNFTTSAQPSSNKTQTQLRVTGEHGLGHRFSLEYDLRAGFLSESKVEGTGGESPIRRGSKIRKSA